MRANTLDLIRRAQAGDSAADTQLIEENNGLIWSIARRYLGRGIENDDLYQMASLGFLKAVRGFDCGYGTQFSTYAVPKIAGEIRRFLRDDGTVKVSRSIKDKGRQLRLARQTLEHQLGRTATLCELADFAQTTIEDITLCEQAMQTVESLEQPAGEEGLTWLDRLSEDDMEEKLTLHLSLQDAVAHLPTRLGEVIALRYGRGMTQQQTARIIGVSQVQISRLEKQAIAALRAEILV